ncbi:hypothetical protein SAMN05421743_107149 [Thalassobacillus cyri]|uniref:Uncharacterized protein n=1 Tax=Thalassobacillus cyri TaxID=571932 RepID=A0A1H4DJ95_9BACI|nr:SE1561 family protein [Thalassobacillus cyri]SEA72559.1 hypothetical protein SAMN05421743_107149 [Thalassobacillus cyri]
MGKASKEPIEQFRYIKKRIHMLNQVVESMEEEEVDINDLQHLTEMITQLQIKLARFKKDWESYK